MLLEFVFLFFTVILHGAVSHDPHFNPNGPDFEGQIGNLDYAIFASVAVTRNRALELCKKYYPGGNLAWLGEQGLPESWAIFDTTLMYHYANANNFFWIDGHPEDPNCDPDTTCLWKKGEDSLLSPFAFGKFVSTTAVCYNFENGEGSQRTYWPAFVPNANNEVGLGKTHYIGAANGDARAGFICASPPVLKCPFGYDDANVMEIPEELWPEPTLSDDKCLE